MRQASAIGVLRSPGCGLLFKSGHMALVSQREPAPGFDRDRWRRQVVSLELPGPLLCGLRQPEDGVHTEERELTEADNSIQNQVQSCLTPACTLVIWLWPEPG